MTVVGSVAAGACALLFLAAVLGKLDSWKQWSELAKEIPGPPVLGGLAQVLVPILEFAIVLLSFAWPVIGLAAGAIALTGFAVAVWFLAHRMSGRDCNCFGAIAPAAISPQLAARNVVLAAGAAAGWYVAQRATLGAMSLSEVLLTVLVGVIVLMGAQYRALRETALRVSADVKEVE